MTLCQENSVNANTANDNLNSKANKDARASVEKLKASNFPATHLKIGSWEVHSRLCMWFFVLGNVCFSMNLSHVNVVFIAV